MVSNLAWTNSNATTTSRPSRTRIVGGIETKRNEYPFIVSLFRGQQLNGHFCGGSIIDTYWVVTAGSWSEPYSLLYICAYITRAYSRRRTSLYVQLRFWCPLDAFKFGMDMIKWHPELRTCFKFQWKLDFWRAFEDSGFRDCNPFEWVWRTKMGSWLQTLHFFHSNSAATYPKGIKIWAVHIKTLFSLI